MKTQQYDAGKLMSACKADVITQLQKDILPLQGFKTLLTETNITIGSESIEACFPNAIFPIGSVHEFLTVAGDIAPTNGFVAALLTKLMQFRGVCIWISASRTLFPPALKTFGVEPDQIIFIDLKKEKDVLWTMEEALKCDRLTAVLGELREISFKESRRLQLAVEQSRVTGFLLRHQPCRLNTIACVARWRITSFPSELEDGMPGVGFPRWHVELLKVRNGRLGNWTVEWSTNQFQKIEENIFSISQNQRRKTG
jgi:protein ImuA